MSDPVVNFLKYEPILAAFCLFLSFSHKIQLQIEKTIYVVVGIRTRGCRIVGADGSTELWRPPNPEVRNRNLQYFLIVSNKGLQWLVFGLCLCSLLTFLQYKLLASTGFELCSSE